MKKKALVGMYLAAPLIPILILWSADPQKYQDPQYAVPSVLGCMAYAWLCLQIILAARIKFIDRAFGLDKVYRFHGYMAFVGILLALMHKQIEESLFGEYFATQIGSLAIAAFIAATLISLAFMTDLIVGKLPPLMKLRHLLEKMGITYSRAVWLHGLSILGVVAMYVHITFAGSFAQSVAVKIIITLYLLLTLCAFAYHKWLERPCELVVSEVIRESTDVVTVCLSPAGERSVFSYQPGQFAYIRFPGKGILGQQHPFTISSSPTEPTTLSFTIKMLGAFTKNLANLEVGDRALVKGPYGKFSYRLRDDRKKFLFVAGGIGVTPFLSMLQHMSDVHKDHQVTLIWGIRKEEDLIQFDDLERQLDTMPNLKIIPVLSVPSASWTGRKGYVDQACIQEILTETKLATSECDAYVCGPPHMTSLVKSSLKELGFKSNAIVTERFTL